MSNTVHFGKDAYKFLELTLPMTITTGTCDLDALRQEVDTLLARDKELLSQCPHLPSWALKGYNSPIRAFFHLKNKCPRKGKAQEVSVLTVLGHPYRTDIQIILDEIAIGYFGYSMPHLPRP